MTHQDTLKAQETLLHLINFKTKYPFLTFKERIVFPTLLANAFLSQANECKIKPTLTLNGKVYLLGHDVHHFGLRLLDMKVVDGKTKINGTEIEASILWKILKKYCLILFPMALSEAIHLSKEKERAIYTTPGYEWQIGKKD